MKSKKNETEALRPLALGIPKQGFRSETDAMGKIEVPADRYWGAQTQRSLVHFSIGGDRMPKQVYRAYGYIKKAAAILNGRSGVFEQKITEAIIVACNEVIEGKLDEHFPLYVWQTGSGTQTNMNVNEVISNRAIQLLGGEIGSKNPVHPNDDVNHGQSSNDTFPTAMHIATVLELDQVLIPEASRLADALEKKSEQWMSVVKVGRTHLQDATPLTVGQEWSGYVCQIRDALAKIAEAERYLFELAVGGTAVGTGLNAPSGFSEEMANQLAELIEKPFVTAPNKFAALASLDAMVSIMAAIRGLAVALMKIANDIRWLSSGPRCGLGELILPENEPGSSIMPGKVNPTQCEALVMICIQVMGDDHAVSFAGSQGNLELNTMRPLVINNVLHSITTLGGACKNFREFTVSGTTLHLDRIAQFVEDSLMLVTALAPVVGYDQASKIAHNAHEKRVSLKESAVESGLISPDDFDRIVDPQLMVGKGVRGA